MKHFRLAALATAAIALTAGAAVAQQRPVSPEQRIERLERQLQQVQRQVFPRGRPADTAGFSDEPAASQASVASLNDRLGALERQLADTLRQAEENGFRNRNMEAEITRLRTEQETRIADLERRLRVAEAAAVAQPVTVPGDSGLAPRPSATLTPPIVTVPTTSAGTNAAAAATVDAGEEAYSVGFRQWQAGSYGEAVTTLRAFAKDYPKHRRLSFANNLIGRSLLDQGRTRDAAAAFLANYRSNPRGERAPDSLFYLGQSLMKLGQPGQACKSYEELQDVYGAKLRDELKTLLAQGRSEAGCS